MTESVLTPSEGSLPGREALRPLEQFRAENVLHHLRGAQPFPLWPMAESVLEQITRRHPGATPVAVAGSAGFEQDQNGSMSAACDITGRMLRKLPKAVLLTGGMPGVGQSVALAFCGVDPRNAPLFQLLPRKHKIEPLGVGTTLIAGASFPERQIIFGMCAGITVVIGGGPGATREANVTLQSGGTVLPIGCSGGAAGGLTYDLPDPLEQRIDLALARQRAIESGFMSVEHWQAMAEGPSPDRAARIIFTAIQRQIG